MSNYLRRHGWLWLRWPLVGNRRVTGMSLASSLDLGFHMEPGILAARGTSLFEMFPINPLDGMIEQFVAMLMHPKYPIRSFFARIHVLLLCL